MMIMKMIIFRKFYSLHKNKRIRFPPLIFQRETPEEKQQSRNINLYKNSQNCSDERNPKAKNRTQTVLFLRPSGILRKMFQACPLYFHYPSLSVTSASRNNNGNLPAALLPLLSRKLPQVHNDPVDIRFDRDR